jgi:hypothetical protein
VILEEIMSHYIIPNLFEQSTVKQFFLEFIAANSVKVSFSQRSFSMKIGWPISCISDVLSGRRSLTLERAIQLGNFLKLNPLDFEKLIYLTISDSIGDPEALKRIKTGQVAERGTPIVDDDLLTSAKTMLVYEAIRWLGEFATLEKVSTIANERRIDHESVKLILQALIEKKMIAKNGSIYQVLKPGCTSDVEVNDKVPEKKSSPGKLWQEFAEFQQIFLEDPKSHAFFCSHLLIMSKSKFNEVREKMNAFNNWIMENDLKDADIEAFDDARIFQFDLNLSPIVNEDNIPQLKK